MTGMDDSDVARITIQLHGGALIASIQVDLEERVLRRLRVDLLEQIQASKARVVVIDLTGVDVMDADDFAELRRTIDMASLLGTETLVCGVRPGVAAALVDLDVPIEGLRASLNLDRALAEIATTASRASQAPAEGPEGREMLHDTAGNPAGD